MSRNRNLADLINGIDASKITSGTFADARISSSSVSQHAQSFDDNKIVNDISTLAIRQASNENKAAYNTNSMFVDVFQDSSGITNLTNASRSENEYVASVYEGTPAEFDYNGQSTKATVKWTNLQSHNDTEYEIDNDGDSSYNDSKFVIPSLSLSGGGLYPNYFPGDDNSISGLNTYYQYDYKQNRSFKQKIKVGKCNTWGDISGYRLQYSTDASSWSDWDMSGVSAVGTSYSANAISNGHNSGGTFNSGTGTSNGTITFLDNNTSGIYSTVTELQGVASITARYIRLYITSLHNGKQNNNAGGGIFAPFEAP